MYSRTAARYSKCTLTARDVPTLGSRSALFRCSTMPLIDWIDPFLRTGVVTVSTSPVSRRIGSHAELCGVFAIWWGSHLEVASDEEFPSHDGQLVSGSAADGGKDT